MEKLAIQFKIKKTEMSNHRIDHVSLRIDKKLSLLSPTHSEHCIFRVHDQLRKENEEVYEPKVIAIGPYHHGKKNLKAMEEYKLRYLQQVLQLNNDPSAYRYVMAMRDLEEKARKCYAEPINISNDDFVEMMVLDGFFIIHLFRKLMFKDIASIDPNDLFIRYAQTRYVIRRDLMLFENQLPFFVLVQLWDMTKFSHPKDNIVDLVLHCFERMTPLTLNASEASARVSANNVDHILGLIHETWCSSFVEVVSQSKHENQEEGWEFIKCATELREAGVKFKKSSEKTISLLDIKFKNGVMEIPSIVIDNGTEGIFRNLLAYEQFRPCTYPKYVTDYATLINYLINSANDVKILQHYGIIRNCLGDDEAVCTMFNKLGNHITMSENFSYSEVFNNVNMHCRQRRNIWLANLRRNYFNSPWTAFSFLAAAILLLLTLAQTIFSVISYGK